MGSAMSGLVNWSALANVVFVGVIVGGGLPALFALGVRALDGAGSRDDLGERKRARVVAAVACFSLVIAALLFAIVLVGLGS